jgi:chitinase
MPKDLNVELELRQNYVDSDVTESIVRYVHAHGFDAKDVDELLLELGYDEIFKEINGIDYPPSYEKIA